MSFAVIRFTLFFASIRVVIVVLMLLVLIAALLLPALKGLKSCRFNMSIEKGH
jgi:hypothetical protein